MKPNVKPIPRLTTSKTTTAEYHPTPCPLPSMGGGAERPMKGRYLRLTTISNPNGRSVTFAFSPTRAPGARRTR